MSEKTYEYIRRNTDLTPEEKEQACLLVSDSIKLAEQIRAEVAPEIEAMRTAEAYKNNGLTAILPNNEDTYGSDREIDFGTGYRMYAPGATCDVEPEAWDKEIIKTSGHTGDMDKPL